jgi:cytochrome P450
MIEAIPQTKWHENLRFLLAHFIPYYLSGIFIRCRFFSGLFRRLHIHPFHPRFFVRLQAKYATDSLYVSLLGRRILLLFNPADVQVVLEHSPAIFAEPDSKQRGMGHFQPEALTISRGNAWQKRRRFNEAALDTPLPVHRAADIMLQRISALMPASGPRNWPDFSQMFDDIALTVVFGQVTAENKAALRDLYTLMGDANRLFWLKPSTRQAALEALIRKHMHQPPAGCLLSMMPPSPNDPQVKPARQAPHWLFALGDTLSINVMRALMLIVSDDDIYQRVCSEISQHDIRNATGIADMTLLDGCLQEAMRLWPTTPVLARKSIRRATIAGTEVAAGTEVMILNNVLHRNTRIAEDANLFRPERWTKQIPAYTYNAMSDGTQGCAGRHLALLLGKFVLAQLLTRWDYSRPFPSVKPGKHVPYIHNHFEQLFTTGQRHD